MNITSNAAAATASATATTPATETAGKSAFSNGDFETFLRMLTTQIQNQDPMNPMEGSDFAVQLATFSGVEQQVRTNQLLEALSGAGTGSLAQYADWIGKDVRTTAPVPFAASPITLDLQPDSTADEVVLVCRDKFGRIASSEKVGQGRGEVDWFGRDSAGVKLPNGNYTFELENWKGGKKISTTPVETYARVSAIEKGERGAVLLLPGDVRVWADEVTGVREPVAGRQAAAGFAAL